MNIQRYLELSSLGTVDRFGEMLPSCDNRKQSRRRLGMAFTTSNITNLTGVKSTFSINGTATGTAAITGGNAPTADMTRSVQRSFTYSTAGANTINQYVQTVFTATKNTTTSLDLTGSLTDFLSGASCTFAIVREIWFEYLTLAQDASNGTNASATATVKIKFGAANPITTTPLGADGFCYIKLGEKIIWQNNDATGWAVTAGTGDKIDFVHAVNDYDAKFLVTIFGEK